MSRNFNFSQAANNGITVLPDLTVLPNPSDLLVVKSVSPGLVDLGFASAALSSGAVAMISDTAPAGAPASSLWWDSTGTGLYIRYNDGSSTQWVSTENQAAIGTVKIADNPPTAADNSLWWDSGGTGLYVRYNDGNSTQWVATQNPYTLTDSPHDGNTYARQSGNWVNLATVPLPGGPFLPCAGGTVGSTPYAQTMFTFNPVNPRNGSGALMLNKVSGSRLGDDPQITSYWAQDYNGGANPFHVQIITSTTGNTGVWSFMNQSYCASNDTGATNGHVGFYSQQVRTGINPGGARGLAMWSGIFELRSQTGLPSSQDGILQPIEIDLLANGADDLDHSVGFGRTVISIVIGQHDPSGAAVEVSNGISFFMMAGASNGHFKNVLSVATPFNDAVLNTINATQMSGANAIWLRDGHSVAWNTAGTAKAYWDGTYVQFGSPVQINGNLFAVSNLTVGGLAALAGGGSSITPAPGNNSTAIATTAFVTGAVTTGVAGYLPLATGGTVAGATTFSASGTGLTVTNAAQVNGMLTAQGGAIVDGAAGWGAHNAGKNLLITTPGGTNPALGITDSTGANIYAIGNNFNQIYFAKMPPLSDSSTAPTYLFGMSPTLISTSIPMQHGTVGFNGTAPIAKPTVSGAKNTNPALASLLTALAAYGLVTDSTSA